jgi:polyisoprenyl-phosphate glycosyltransferase
MATKPTVSIVIPAFNEAPCLAKLHQELRAVCDGLPYQFELIFVNDGSSDATMDVLAGLRAGDDRVRYLALSRNFGHQGALSAGLAFAGGDAVIMMDADLQHPPGLIPILLARWQDGYDVVNTVRLETEDSEISKTLSSRAFYWLFRALTGLAMEPGSADFRLMAREPINALNSLPERHRFIRGLVPWLGFRQTSVSFSAPARFAGSPKYTFRRSLRLALDGITAFNLYPLRLLALLGLALMGVSSAFGLMALCRQLLGGPSIGGWTTLLISVHFLGGCQLASLGIISEYVGRALDQVTGRPLYILSATAGFPCSPTGEKSAVPAPHFSLPARQPAGARSEAERTS